MYTSIRNYLFPRLFIIVPLLLPLAAEAQSTGERVQIHWTDMVDAQVMEGNTLTKTAGCAGCLAGARSQQSLDAGDVYVSFTIPDVSKLHWVGLTNDPTRLDDEVLDFAIRVQSGNAEIRENGAYQGDTQVSNGDRFRIAVENGTVKYYRNDVHFHTSSKPVEYPLYLGALLADEGAAVADATAVPSGGRGVALQ